MGMNKENMPQLRDLQNKGKYYTDEGFNEKVSKTAKAAGLKVIYKAFLLFYTLLSPKTPATYKALIYGGLGYFICPIDLIPDFIPFAGFTDDVVALGLALSAIASGLGGIDNSVKESARERLGKIFDLNEDDINELEELEKDNYDA